MLRDSIQQLRTTNRISKRKLNFRLAPEAVNYSLTGFLHNAVSPFGLRKPLPIVLCQRCADLNYIYLGGGEPDLKLGIAIEDLIRGLNPIITMVSHQK
jgi:prolyl-tRNA editing enzyme YbaK/EbsC (Cys-tRNA(Pro) deacylase)